MSLPASSLDGGKTPLHSTPQSQLLTKSTMLTVFLIALFSVPSIVMYYGRAESQSTGLAAVIGVTLIVMVLSRKAGREFLFGSAILAGISTHAVIAFLITRPDFNRAIASLILAGAALALGAYVANWMFRLPAPVVTRGVAVIRLLMVGCALVSIVGIQPVGTGQWEKSVFPFTEPSHFALVFTPLMLHACVTNRGFYRYVWLATGLGLTIALQSLSLAVGVAIAGLLTLSIAELALLFVIILGVIGAIDISYFADRLDFNSHTKNISTLVYLEGLELASDAFHRTGGWGLGFQQLGQGSFSSPSADAIFKLTNGRDLNVEDGGFVAAKIVAEFGLFGIAALILIVRRILDCARRLRTFARQSSIEMALTGYTLALIFVVGTTVELFVRGIGYFSGTILLALAGGMYLHGLSSGHRAPDARR